MSAYCTSKAGLNHFTKQVALDYGPANVRTIMLNDAPGFNGATVWVPVWTNDVRFTTMCGPFPDTIFQ